MQLSTTPAVLYSSYALIVQTGECKQTGIAPAAQPRLPALERAPATNEEEGITWKFRELIRWSG